MIKKFLPFILILIVCFLAYGQTLLMYFYLEDYLIIYSIQHPDSSDAGYGSGNWGRPFGYAVTPFIPFYHLFKMEPTGYYLVQILLYFFAALAVYFLAKTLTDNKKAALGSALIFSSGYVGSDALHRMAVGWQNILAATFISISAALYYRYTKKPKIKLYLMALAFYLFTSEFSFYRAHGIILIILGIEILFNFHLVKSIVRMLPFALSYWYFYIYSLTGDIDQSSKSASYLKNIFIEKKFELLLTPLKTLQNLFIPDKFEIPLFMFVAFLISVLIWKRSKILIYCLVFAVSSYLVHSYVSPTSVPETIHRYLTVSFVGSSMFLGVFFNQVFKNIKNYFLLCALVALIYIGLGWSLQNTLIQNRSKPARAFWQSLLKEVPNISKKSVIYVDTKDDGNSKPLFDAVVNAGSMSPAASIAIRYGVKWEDIYLPETFSELLGIIKSEKVDPDNIYTFFFSNEKDLINTSEETRNTLFGDVLNASTIDLSNINKPHTSPALLTFSSDVDVDFANLKFVNTKDIDLPKYLSYLLERNRYYEKVSVTTTSEARYAEVRNIKDKNEETSWKGDDLVWANTHKEEVVINLGENKLIGGMRIKPSTHPRMFTRYQYECSNDEITWKILGKFEKKVDKAETFVDKFEGINCSIIKLIIFETVSDGPPQISEIEVLENKFTDVDFSLADEISKNPFAFIQSSADLQVLSNYLAKNGVSGEICTYTDKQKPTSPECKSYIFKIGTNNNNFIIEPSGTTLQKIEFKYPPEVRINVKNALIKHLTLSELDKTGYIVEYAD